MTALAEPFFFGPENRLFGLYHPPAAHAAMRNQAHAIIICPSVGLEYMRTYRGIRLLADALCESGYHVLRFDYSNSGDSVGLTNDAGFDRWQEDVRAAKTELEALSGAKSAMVFGLRIGALIAQSALHESECPHFLAWDPPENGQKYWSTLNNVDGELESSHNRYRTAKTRMFKRHADEINGFFWNTSIRSSISDLSYQTGRSLNFYSSGLGLENTSGDTVVLSDEAHWHEATWVYTPWLPIRSIQEIVTVISERLP